MLLSLCLNYIGFLSLVHLAGVKSDKQQFIRENIDKRADRISKERRFTSKLRQRLIVIGSLQSILEIQSDFDTAHTLKIKLPFGITPCLEMLPAHLSTGWNQPRNILTIHLKSSTQLQITIYKHFQPVFYLMANDDKGLTLFPPETEINLINYYGNTIKDMSLLPDVSFPFISFVVLTIGTFFFVQYHVTKFFLYEETENK